jgi:hypothetical protein
MTDEQIEKIVTEAVYGSDSHHWSAEAQVRKALAVAKQHLSPQWQPIETAPKDGREVLVGRFKRGCPWNGRIAVDWYRGPRDNAGFIGWCRFNPQHWPATHWMPLPKPPENGHD